MKNYLPLLMLSILTLFIACQPDDEDLPNIPLENCDDSGCDTKSCATLIPLLSDVVCTIENSSDVDWYQIEITQDQVDNNFGTYAFNFIHVDGEISFQVNLFSVGVAAGDVTVTGNGDLTYEPLDDKVGGIQFFAPGTYYFSVQALNGQSGSGTYEIRIN